MSSTRRDTASASATAKKTTAIQPTTTRKLNTSNTQKKGSSNDMVDEFKRVAKRDSEYFDGTAEVKGSVSIDDKHSLAESTFVFNVKDWDVPEGPRGDRRRWDVHAVIKIEIDKIDRKNATVTCEFKFETATTRTSTITRALTIRMRTYEKYGRPTGVLTCSYNGKILRT